MRHDGASGRLAEPCLALASVLYVSLEKSAGPADAGAGASAGGGAVAAPPTGYADIAPILTKHCVGCHSKHPANPAFAAPPVGLVLDSYEHASVAASRIRSVAVDAETMPLGNATNMSRAKRDRLGAWISQGTPR